MMKGVKCRRLGWTLLDENIENVERLSLVPKVQRELGCSVGEHVFLEYPWAFVPREAVLKLASMPGSSLEPHRSKIEAYGGETFLLGYSSVQLIACDFVICLTEDARSVIVKRNADISKKLREEVVRKIKKTGGPWESLGSDLDDRLLRSTRDFFQVEVCFSISSLGCERELSDRSSKDSWDSYAELLPYESFENVEKKRISRMIQTHFEPRDIEVQTYPGNPKNAWTQYVYEDTMGGIFREVGSDHSDAEEEEKSELEEKRETESSREASERTVETQKPTERGPLELFLMERAPEMIDAVCYNTVVNLHVDDIEALARRQFEIVAQSRDEVTAYAERFSLVDLHFAAGKVISDASWHPSLLDCVVVSYASSSSCDVIRSRDAPSRAEPTALLWSLDDPLRPRLSLRCHREIYCVSFCPTNGDFVIGGSASGQVVVWNIHGRLRDREDVEQRILDAGIASERGNSHEVPIRRIQWLPDNCRIEPSGKLTRLSASSSCQFVTIAEDGIVAIWDLLRYSITSQLKPSDLKGLDDTFRPIYRLNARPSKDSPFTPLYLCLPSDQVFQEGEQRQRDHGESEAADVDCTRRLWIGTAQGDLVCCTWEGQVFDVETSGLEECRLLGRSSAHDGPVTAILRSPHLHDVLLTTGGHVFAVWKDDYPELPLFRRRSDRVYTACCWSNRPGLFLTGTNLGDLEVWDIRCRANRPVLVQTISRRPITLLSLRESCGDGFRLLGAGDCSSAFRIFGEPAEPEDDIVERLDWFEEYVWREVRRKRMFSSWQKEFLRNDPGATGKRQARVDEERRVKLETARLQLHRQHEERLRLEAEEKMRQMPKSKDTVWKMRQQGRMKKVLLKKKRFVPRELEEKRLPLVRLAEERDRKMIKARNEAALQDKYFDNFVSFEFPEHYDLEGKGGSSEEQREMTKSEEMIGVYLREFRKIKEEAREIMEQRPYVPKFDRSICAKKGKEI
ncbi:PREDICTED: WD repeat-containing protein 63-like [Dinoponera quadriceps]|uniref:WD repeat-containing protein 63-like n=1 Tax=Dinoponera quadriceps TaxID=609295 RepID=A0A6P3YH69_DINQU|nr:PREDICTED: WD repeat-containing protein 63-like [Dinoponera quadriceps]XP_014489254.1 PREDICTED: WD repeat-containing protein 63-like [Dinoponera quadriceps]